MSILGLHERKRRLLIPAVGVLLAAGFFLGFQPRARKAQSLDAPLGAAWKRLATQLGESNATTLDFDGIQARLAQTRQAWQVLETAKRQAAERVEPGPQLRDRLRAPFQLVDFQNAAERQIADLERRAREKGVTLAPAVAAGFPAHMADVQQPELLWAELAFVTDLLTLALDAQVSTIQSLSLPLALTNPPPSGKLPGLVEIPVQLELTGPLPAVARFLAALPRRAGDTNAGAAPNPPSDLPTNKPALFIDRLMVRKQSPEKPDDVRLTLRAAGFVFRHRAPGP
jgi:hypothetical protein